MIDVISISYLQKIIIKSRKANESIPSMHFRKNQQRISVFQFPEDPRMTSKTYSHLVHEKLYREQTGNPSQQLRRTYNQSIEYNRNNHKKKVQDSRKSSKSYHSNSKYQPRVESHRQSKKGIRQSIPDLMQEMQDVLNRKKGPIDSNITSSLSSVVQESFASAISNKYPSEISVLKSGISVLTKEAEDEIHLPKLQKTLAQRILQLRQQKILLLSQQSRIIDQKNQIERQIKKILKNRRRMHEEIINDNIIEVFLPRESQILLLNPDSQRYKNLANKKAYFPVMQRYLKLKKRQGDLQQYQKQNREQFQQKMQKIYQENKDIKNQFEKYQKLNKQMQETQLALNSETYEETIIDLNKKVAQLQAEKAKFHQKIDMQKYQQISVLRQQNQKLIAQANRILQKKKRLGQVTSMEGLVKIVNIEDDLKEQLFTQMRMLKQQHDAMVKQNNVLRRGLQSMS